MIQYFLFFVVYKDRDGVIKRLTSRSNQQRQTIAKKFNIRYKQVRAKKISSVHKFAEITHLHMVEVFSSFPFFNCYVFTVLGLGEVT